MNLSLEHDPGTQHRRDYEAGMPSRGAIKHSGDFLEFYMHGERTTRPRKEEVSLICRVGLASIAAE
jgi:hypothetical protein